MHRKRIAISLLAGVALAVSSANAYEFRAQWVERFGTVDVVVNGPIDTTHSDTFRLRLQIGVFDDASGPAPAGGIFGWSMGTYTIDSENPAWSDERRTPGRLAPFRSSTHPNANGNPPLPDGDPFELLTDIDATIGDQSLVWGFDASGNPLPQPTPQIRGRNQYVSVFEVTADPSFFDYDHLAAGNLVAVTQWDVLGTPIPPDPNTQTPGSVIYTPVLTEPGTFQSSLTLLYTPAPGTALPFGAAALWSTRRRR